MSNATSEPATPQPNTTLTDVLGSLRHRPIERISINTKQPVFRSNLMTVASLTDWSPPDDRDTWFGVNPIARSVRRGRGTEADVTRVRAVWADLDIKKGSLASLTECYAVTDLVSEWLGCPPSVLIESGHGLQPIWRIRSTPTHPNRVAEHWPGSAGDVWALQRWRTECARWGGLVAVAAATVHPGARVDSVYDLARVLRCPGTVNYKQSLAPVPVRTALNAAAPGVTRRGLVNVLDGHSIVVAPTTPTVRGVPTAPREAVEWINAQNGADVDWDGMSPVMQKLVVFPRLVELFAHGTDTESSAHSLMTSRVLAVTYAATEGRAGLALALELIRTAYLEVMARRRSGEFDGEARSEGVASSDFYRAVFGAVSKARMRPVLDAAELRYGTEPLRVTNVVHR
ncbi:hypothetical protein O4220_19605 [Rhodococcus ruber]|uniref:Uncharacterized protein n=1 Tax=Rhodococcus ruber TaxID=1830 RepID=A0ABT4MIA7_9NOCA|nr:hypothetical protein [Rhodococcus ruber]MCZ4520721.1 hypothetical protein [Rhodococcus ruber]